MNTSPSIFDQYRQSVAALPPPPMPNPSVMMAGPTPAIPIPQASNVQRIPTQLENDQAKYQQIKMAGPGEAQLYHKIAGSQFGQNHPILGKVLGGLAAGATGAADIGLDTLGGGIGRLAAEQIPGTILNHQVQLNRANKDVATDEANAEKEAQTANLANQPELGQAKQDLAEEKQHEVETNHQNTLRSTLAQHGFAMDEDGSIRPLRYDEMNPTQQSVIDLKGAQEELADANAAYKKAQKDNLPQAMEMARQRIEVAKRNAATAAGRLGLSQAEYNANYLGTDAAGNALPGAPATPEGKPEGIRTANITKPTAATQSRGQQGGAIIEAGNNLKKEIDANPDVFGNIGSYWKQYTNGTPISNPAASKMMAEIGSYAALQPAMHGFRGAQALREFEKLIGGIPKNAEALKAAIDGIASTAGVVQRSGRVPTVGGGEHPKTIRALDPQGVLHEAPAGTPLPKGWKLQ